MAIEKEFQKGDALLESVKNKDSKTLEKLYDEHRKPFVLWSSQLYQCSEEDAIEIYQKAFTIFYFNVQKGKLTKLTSSVKTYLFSIGKNLFREKFRDKHNKLVNLDDVSNTSFVQQAVDNSILDNYQNHHQKEIVKALLDEIGDPCKTLLQLIFIQNYSVDAVVEAMNYSDERVVRKRKSLCLKKMREMVAERKDSGFFD
jgi:RNA polymerase sigma factor (sigma-70 family)